MTPTLILWNGKIVTLDQQDAIQEAVAIRGNQILAVGTNAKIRALAGGTSREVNLLGRAVIPGLIDSHYQFYDRASAQYYGAHIDLPSSVEDVLKAVRVAAARIPKGQTITSNSGWYPHMLAEGRAPTRAELDQAAPDHPVILRGEFLYLNSSALKLSGITKNTPQPASGWIGKEEASGEPTGVLFGTAARLAHPSYSTFTDDQRAEALVWAGERMLSSGITSIRDPKRSASEIRVYQSLYHRRRLPVRICSQMYFESAHSPAEVLERLRQVQLSTPIGDHWFRIDRAGYFYTDGGYHRMKMKSPIIGLPAGIPDDGAPHFESEQSPETLEEIVVGMAKLGFTGSIMSAGDRAVDMALDVLEKADREVGIRDRRWVMAHVIYPSKEQIARIKALGVIVTPMWHHYYYYPVQVFYHGEAVAQRTEPFRDLLDQGVTVAQGTDISTIPLNYFPGIYFMVTRDTWKWGKANSSQSISRVEALRTMTTSGAFLTFEEHVKGSLEAGKLADMVVLSGDLLTVPVEQIPAIRPLATIVDGEVKYRDPKTDIGL